jgi:hypothetical protein
MSIEEELQEHAEHAKNPLEKKVAATMAILAAVLAVVSVLGHLATTEEILNQQKASDQWSYYQAKTIRRYESEIARDLLSELKAGPAKTGSAPAKAASGKDEAGVAPAAERRVTDYTKNVERYSKEGEEIQGEAKKLEEESHLKGNQALRFHLGEVFVEVGIVLASLSILTKRKGFWLAAMAGGVVGVAIAATAAMLH